MFWERVDIGIEGWLKLAIEFVGVTVVNDWDIGEFGNSVFDDVDEEVALLETKNDGIFYFYCWDGEPVNPPFPIIYFFFGFKLIIESGRLYLYISSLVK